LNRIETTKRTHDFTIETIRKRYKIHLIETLVQQRAHRQNGDKPMMQTETHRNKYEQSEHYLSNRPRKHNTPESKQKPNIHNAADLFTPIMRQLLTVVPTKGRRYPRARATVNQCKETTRSRVSDRQPFECQENKRRIHSTIVTDHSTKRRVSISKSDRYLRVQERVRDRSTQHQVY
jgi:hypothetical protein